MEKYFDKTLVVTKEEFIKGVNFSGTNAKFNYPWNYLAYLFTKVAQLEETAPADGSIPAALEALVKDNETKIQKMGFQIAWLSEKTKELLKTVETLQELIAPKPTEPEPLPEPTPPPPQPEPPVSDPLPPPNPPPPPPPVEEPVKEPSKPVTSEVKVGKTKKIKLTL